MSDTEQPIAHCAIEVPNASDNPGDGQIHIARILRQQKKLLGDGDQPDAPSYVRDQTPLKTKGEATAQPVYAQVAVARACCHTAGRRVADRRESRGQTTEPSQYPSGQFDARQAEALADGIDQMSREEAGYWLGMAMHRKYSRRVLAAIRT